MPLRFLERRRRRPRLRGSCFETYPDNYDGTGRGAVWRHGDWLKIGPDGTCTIYGRSDATINRHGLRMGTSELYSAIEALPEVLDSMVVDLEYLGRESYMPLFVVLRDGVMLDRAMQARINAAIEASLSRRFLLTNEIIAGPEDSTNAVGKEAGIADQETAARPAAGEDHQQGRDGQSRMPGLVSQVCAGVVWKDASAGAEARMSQRDGARAVPLTRSPTRGHARKNPSWAWAKAASAL